MPKSFSDESTTSCFAEATSLATALATKQAAVQLAKAKGDGLRAAQDSLDIQMVSVGEFAKKLHRYEDVVRGFANTQLKALSASMPKDTKDTKAAQAAKDAVTKIEAQIKSWDAKDLLVSVGARACAKS
jgi:hypothetical protein